MPGNSSDVRIAKNRGSGFTAIGAIEAIEGAEYHIMLLMKPSVKLLVFPIFLQKGFNFLPLSFAFIQP
jgi:hypothetical protein